jgi:DUF1009 family protein
VNPRDGMDSRARAQSESGEGSIGLIAGAGSLPLEAARLLRSRGLSVFAVGFEGLSDRSIATEVVEIRFLRLGQLEAMAAAMTEMGVRRLLLLGKVSKSLLFDGRGIAQPDAEAIQLLSEQPERGDEPLMRAIARWLTGRGFELCDQSETLAPLLASIGLLSGRAPSEGELSDFELGRRVVVQLGSSGVGQCVVVKQGSVLAVEAIEGTDETIRRAGELGGPGATVIKAARPGQDRRFDLPAIGSETIEAMIAAGATALAIEAHSTLIIDRERFTKTADRAGIAVWGFGTESSEDRPAL